MQRRHATTTTSLEAEELAAADSRAAGTKLAAEHAAVAEHAAATELVERTELAALANWGKKTPAQRLGKFDTPLYMVKAVFVCLSVCY